MKYYGDDNVKILETKAKVIEKTFVATKKGFIMCGYKK